MARDVVVIGAPIGGAGALIQVSHALPPDLPAIVLMVLHAEPEKPILLADVLSAPGHMRASDAIDGEALEPRRIYVAADGKHLRVEGNAVRLTDAPVQTPCRPSIDILFQTAAEAFRSRVIGVVLLHVEEEGSLGLAQIQAHGGRSITHRNELMLNAPRLNGGDKLLTDDHLALEEIAPRIVSYVRGN